MKNNYVKIICSIFFVIVGLCCLQDITLAATTATTPMDIKRTAFKFLIAMGGVAASSIFLFVGLTVYNKLRTKKIPLEPKRPEPKEPEIIDNVPQAVDFFINQNKL